MRTALCRLGALLLLGGIAITAGRPQLTRQQPGIPVTILVDTIHPLGPISPLIYGMAIPSPAHYRDLKIPLVRWGGNPNTRYNWELGNAWNAARDWNFANVNYVGGPSRDLPSGSADRFITANQNHGAQTLLTIPTMGWVARDHDTRHNARDVPTQGGPPIRPGSEAIAGYDPAENRRRISVRSLPRKGRSFADPPDSTDGIVYQDEWIAHLIHKFGPAQHGGVRLFAMDNEPDLWDTTHTDMHPVSPDYDDLLRQFLTYAEAVKEVDPGAQVTGPVSWGWSGYFFSPRDRGSDVYATHADRRAHANQPFLPWFLREVARHDRRTGRRSLDVLDVHYYPQGEGIYAGRTDLKTNALRLRSTRALWDPSYRDESWVGAAVQLLPRLHQWVHQNYPGTRIGLTEWNWGAEKTLCGGLAAADVLGILGREQIDLACYWTAPPVGSPAFYAFKMYRNADGHGQGFGDIALPAASEAPEEIACYAACERSTGIRTLLLINKMDTARRVKIKAVEKRETSSTAQIFRYDGSRLQNIVRLPDIRMAAQEPPLTLPPFSLTLLRCCP